METRDNSSRETTEPQWSAEHSPKFCPLCRTLNHPLSWECFNCGWRGGFFASNADVSDPKAQYPHAFLSDSYFSACWRRFKLWLYQPQEISRNEKEKNP